MTAEERRAPLPQSDVLVVDDEDDIRELLELSLLRMGLGVETAADLAEARRLLTEKTFRLCLTDMRLPDGDGLDLVRHIGEQHKDLAVAVITAHGSIETAIRALKSGAFDFLTKPVELKALRDLVLNALKAGKAEPAPVPAGRELIGRSPVMAQLRSQIDKLARSQAPVFIHGESGTGKEVIARLIHARGPRGAAPFVPVNCGAISPDLMESEFFGHRKGSFTGATVDKPGLFQAAQGGTLFLDEVAELPLPMQVKLLRAIQEKAVRPVGAAGEEPVDVRILSASHRDLGALVAEGRFRQDLFFRINVITLSVPPLRERREDIPDLAAHILARLAEREGGGRRELSASAVSLLVSQPLPGNVRELENLLERACALCEGDQIGLEDFNLPHCKLDETELETCIASADSSGCTADKERQLILSTLDETRWNRSEAARRLGMTLRQLRYRLDKWGLD
ncbi:MAG: sigma-54 dependent transcriptional regulator [Rhodocyclaceae bacterium]|jgi:two-component system response regulator PilR (NtrC family)|nr:sigma-54 dependent transcriptional regulator [Rhodocyclaceae bacterium]